MSVVLTTFNHEAYIAQAIDSVLAQRTTFEIELLIAEDCSTDRTGAIIEDYRARFPNRIRLHRSEVNRNDKSPFIEAWNDARGRYVAILDGDDFWTHSGKLQQQRDFLDGHISYSACFHNAWQRWDDGSQVPCLQNLADQTETVLEPDIWRYNMIATCSVMFRRHMLTTLPPWFRSAIFEDWPLYMLSASAGPIGYLPEAMAVYRKHPGGVWSGMTLIPQIQQVIAYLKQMNDVWGRGYHDLAQAGIVHQTLALASAYRAAGHSVMACRTAASALIGGMANPHIGRTWLLSSTLRVAAPAVHDALRKVKRLA